MIRNEHWTWAQKRNFYSSAFLSFVHMVKDDTRSYRLHTVKQQQQNNHSTYIRFSSLRLDFFDSANVFRILFRCACVCVCALCWWTLYLWIVYVANFKTGDKNLNATWMATMKRVEKKREDRKKTRKNEKKGIEQNQWIDV